MSTHHKHHGKKHYKVVKYYSKDNLISSEELFFHELEEAIKDAEETLEFYMIKIYDELNELVHELATNNGNTYA